MSDNKLKIDVVLADVGESGAVLSDFVTQEIHNTDMAKKADLVNGKVNPTQLPEFSELSGVTDVFSQLEINLRENINTSLTDSKAYADSIVSEVMSKKADLVNGRVPKEQATNFKDIPGAKAAIDGLKQSLGQEIIGINDSLENNFAKLTNGKVSQTVLPTDLVYSDRLTREMNDVRSSLQNTITQVGEELTALETKTNNKFISKTEAEYFTKDIELKAAIGGLEQKSYTSYASKIVETSKADLVYVDRALGALSTAATKFYPTLALANADIANLQVNQPIQVGEVANGGLWYKATAGATSLTKSPYDPLAQAKGYTNTFVNTRNNLADSFLYSGTLTDIDDLNTLYKDGTYVATSVPLNAPVGETQAARIKIERQGGFISQTYQRLYDSRRVWKRTIQIGQPPEIWRDFSFIGDANIATTSKVGTVKPSTGLTISADGALSVSNLTRSLLADDFNYVGSLNATSDLNVKMKEGAYLTLAAPLNAPAGTIPNVLITNQNVGQRYIQTIYDLVDSRKRWQRVVRFNNDGTFNSAEVWRDLFQIPRTGLTDNFMYNGVFTSATDLNAEHKQGLYISTSLPTNAPVGAPAVSFIEIDRAGSFVKQTITHSADASKRWQRAMQISGGAPIAGGAWKNLDPLSNVASQSNLGVIKAGAGLNITVDGTLSVIAPSQINPFAGKKIVCFGDSITEFKTYPQQLGQMLGAEGINVGFGGCMMSAHWDVGYKEMCMYRLADYIASGDYSGLIAAAQDVYDRTGDDNRAIAARLAAIDWDTVDYITILYGTNDYANGKSIGVATDIKSDGSNYLGSTNYAIQRILTAYPHLKIALITPIYRARGVNGGTDSDDSPNAPTNGRYLRDFCTGLIEVAKLNHVPCFNLHDDSGINKYTASLYLNPEPDGVHLTVEGATLIAQKLSAKMRANF